MNWRAAISTSLDVRKLRLRSRRLLAEQAPLMRKGGSSVRLSLAFSLVLAPLVATAAEPPLTIEQLIAQGWEIAGYASGYDNRTSLILFRHAGVNALVQCGILYDVTRSPRTIVNCYELK
jgi:hypothetical protein